MFSKLFVIAVCLVTPLYGFVSQSSCTAFRNNVKALMAADKPQELTGWGLDDELWNTLPTGAIRDLKRFVRTGKDELAQNRIETLIEINEYRRGSMTDERTWFEASKAWEFANKVKALDAKEKAKAEKRAEVKAKREAAEAEAEASSTSA